MSRDSICGPQASIAVMDDSQARRKKMNRRTYIELVLELFAFIALSLAMMASGKAVVIFSLITVALVIWIPFQANAGNRLTRALSIALPIAAIGRSVVHFLPNPSL
jgi:hypothetical protein